MAALEGSGLSQRQVSKKLGMPSSFLNKVLNGNRPIEFTELHDLAFALNVSFVDLTSIDPA
ncbi:MAG TPA: helix-turn-helix transcriptional regulator [Fimbriimonadaceae bacterium]